MIKERPPRKQSKYVLIYGKTLREIASIFGVSTVAIYYWNKDPVKRKWLKNKLNE